MKILNVKWKNFNSYGNSWTEIDFTQSDQELSLIVGQNGQGKSTIKDVIIFALYGTVPYKKNSSLVNAINKNLECEINFVSNSNIIKVRRGLAPSYFDVIINNNSEVGDVSNKKNVQNILQQYIGINFKIFNNIIALDINKFISFLKISPNDKRQIIDNIFNLNVINVMYELHKNEYKEIKTLVVEFETKINWLNNQVININKQIEVELNKQNECLHCDSDLKQEILDIETKIETHNLKLVELKTKKETAEQLIKKLEKQIYSIQIENKNNITQINNYNKQECPVCGNDLQTNFYENIKTELNIKINANKNIINENKNKLTTIQNKLNLIRDKISEINTINLKLFQSKTNALIKLKTLNSNEQIKIQTLRESVLKLEEQINEYEIKLNEEKSKFNLFDMIDNILNEDGFKKVILGSLMPSFNQQIENFRTILNIPYHVYFNDDFSVNITIDGFDVDINTLSTGETKKLDLCIIFSLLMLMKLQFKDLNLLFLDEVFAGLDLASQNNILEILSIISKKLKLHIFVINHSEMAINNFDRIMSVEKKLFSTLTIENQF